MQRSQNTRNTRGSSRTSRSPRGTSFSRREGGGRPSRFGPRKPYRSPKFQNLEVDNIDYKNLALLQKFLTDRGKMLSHRVTGVTAAQQRQLASAIKCARFLGLLPVGVMK